MTQGKMHMIARAALQFPVAVEAAGFSPSGMSSRQAIGPGRQPHSQNSGPRCVACVFNLLYNSARTNYARRIWRTLRLPFPLS